MPFEGMGYLEDLPSAGKMIGIVVVGGAILAFLMGQRVRMLSRPLVLRVVLVLYSGMSLAWSFDREVTLDYLPRVALALVLMLLIWEFAVTYKDQMWILRSFLVGMLVPLAMAFAQFRGASRFEAEAGERFSGGGADLNYLAYMCSVAVLIAVYLATNASALDRYCRWLYWGMAVLCALECMLTGSRGGFICLLTASVFAMFLAGVSRRRILTIVQVLALSLFVLVLVRYIVPAALLARVTQEQSIVDDPRFGIWMRGLAAVWKSPLFGVGAGDFALATAVGGEKARVAHNTFLSVLVELGVLGLAVYLWYTVLLFRGAWRMPRREKLLWLGALAIWFFNSNSAGSQIDHFTWFVHGMVMVQAAACLQSRPARRLSPYPNRNVLGVRGPKPPRPSKGS